jgi:hypothetical protein
MLVVSALVDVLIMSYLLVMFSTTWSALDAFVPKVAKRCILQSCKFSFLVKLAKLVAQLLGLAMTSWKGVFKVTHAI